MRPRREERSVVRRSGILLNLRGFWKRIGKKETPGGVEPVPGGAPSTGGRDPGGEEPVTIATNSALDSKAPFQHFNTKIVV
jgi:hypothetical protein